jgi:hypothetical protein
MCGPRVIPKLLDRTGRAMDSVERLMVIPGGAEAVVAARRLIVTYALVPYYARVMGVQGFGEEVEAIRSRWQSGDRGGAAKEVSDAMVAELVLAGPAERIRDRLDAYRDAGLGAAALSVAGVGLAELRSLLKQLAS